MSRIYCIYKKKKKQKKKKKKNNNRKQKTSIQHMLGLKIID